jgi:hypothetical protein
VSRRTGRSSARPEVPTPSSPRISRTPGFSTRTISPSAALRRAGQPRRRDR